MALQVTTTGEYYTKVCTKMIHPDYHPTNLEGCKKIWRKISIIMFSCDGISDHAIWNEVFHRWDT